MKKNLIVIILSILVISSLTGCGIKDKTSTKKEDKEKVITCTRSNSDDSSEEIETGIIKTKNDKIASVERNTTYNLKDKNISPEEIKSLLNDLNEVASIYNELDGYTYESKLNNDKSISIILKIDYDKVNLDLIKEKIGEEYIEEFFPNGIDVSFEQIKNEQFKGFECQ